ncbi:MAG: hypothetical protein KIS96_09080 [Bauldia sp.]|nr:hypothetical protein [Bauldia sp.]
MNRVASTTRDSEVTLLAIGLVILAVVLWSFFGPSAEYDSTAALQQLANVYGVSVELKP